MRTVTSIRQTGSELSTSGVSATDPAAHIPTQVLITPDKPVEQQQNTDPNRLAALPRSETEQGVGYLTIQATRVSHPARPDRSHQAPTTTHPTKAQPSLSTHLNLYHSKAFKWLIGLDVLVLAGLFLSIIVIQFIGVQEAAEVLFIGFGIMMVASCACCVWFLWFMCSVVPFWRKYRSVLDSLR